MVLGRSAMPLIALDAAVIDTETTGLDPRSARIVEIGGVRLVEGRIDGAQPFRRLVRPDGPIPASATRIHGINDRAVAGAPDFAAVWPELRAWVGGRVVVGHAIAFDLAMLKRECERAGIAWHAPAALCTRLLAQVAEPALPGYELENLSHWLGVDLSGRHSASGDATTAARIFCALVPRLRERGIRTLAEAMRACAQLTDSAGHARGSAPAGPTLVWNEPDPAAARVDIFPYRHRAGDIMSSPPKIVAADATLSAALGSMAKERISSVFVAAAGRPPRAEDTGIVTERDVLRALATHGEAALAMPVQSIMSRPLATVPVGALAYAAIARMNRLKIRHLGITDDVGNVVGALSARDLLKQRAGAAAELGDEIGQANDVHGLGLAWAKLMQVAAGLVEEGLSAREVAAVVSQRVAEMTQHAAALAEAEMERQGHGAAPCLYAFMVLGSAARGESLLAMDQDNALVFADDAPPGADAWFAAFATRVSDILDQAGVPLCKGGVMAKNPRWRGSHAAWRQRIADWIRQLRPEDLLAVDIFFDLRGVRGDEALADSLWREAYGAARGNVSFAKLLIEAAGTPRPSRTWFGGLRTEHGRIDLKKAGLFGIVGVARALAVCHHVVARSTRERLAGLKALGIGAEHDLDALAEAQDLFLDLILKQQIEDMRLGRRATNAVEVRRLSRRERGRLAAALQSVEHLDEMARDLLFRG